ncbi:MAG: DUF4286 family protein [Mucilaginibacter sp.]|uniref:DUF4286 family protein n=1 Tax=Mucilaginibacter sp. TaxID=1882438 RepID=UPI00326401FF
MIILNETIILDPEVHTEWLDWVKAEHIPAIMATGHFTGFRILHVLSSPNEGFTYCIQYNADSLNHYEAYEQTVASTLKHKHMKTFENKLVVFESIMQHID